MRFIKTAGACAVIAVGAALASASYADASGSEGFGPIADSPFPASGFAAPSTSAGSLLEKERAVLTDQGISPARARQALDVQGKVAQADLPSELQAAMGSAFAGVWFEPAAAQLHVGATSPASRRTAEVVVARTGLTADVTVTPVRSTMAQLLATQKQWNRKLVNLFEQKEVKTGLEPQRNAVFVTLSPSVSSPERAALKREAATADVNVFVDIVSGQSSVMPQAKTECETFKKNEAFCNRSITPGVKIAGAFLCTAGPVAINGKKERVLLTAGHCIEKEKEALSAKEIAGAEKAIGPVENFVYGGAEGEKKGDYADILIEPGWQTGKPANPVFAVSAEWIKMNEKKEKTSYPVKGERVPVVKNTNCHVGKTSGESCGEISMLNVTFVDEEKGVKKFVEGVVEDTGEKLLSESGDSGGPVVFIEEPSQEVLMEGTYTGDIYECVQVKGEVEGEQFFKTQTECQNFRYLEKKGNKGSWERKKYTCENVKKIEKGPKFFQSQKNCEEGEKAGEGEWKREPDLHVVYQPLKQPVKGAAEGPLEAYKLELLTTANEVIPASLPDISIALGGAYPLHLKFADNGKTPTLTLETTAGNKLTGTGVQLELEVGELSASGKFNALFLHVQNEKEGCSSPGDKAEEVLTSGEFHIVQLPKEGDGILISLKELEITCGKVKAKVKGSVIAALSAGKESEELTEIGAKLEGAKGKNTLTKYLNDSKEEVKAVLEANFGTGFTQAAEILGEEIKPAASESKMFTITKR